MLIISVTNEWHDPQDVDITVPLVHLSIKHVFIVHSHGPGTLGTGNTALNMARVVSTLVDFRKQQETQPPVDTLK